MFGAGKWAKWLAAAGLILVNLLGSLSAQSSNPMRRFLHSGLRARGGRVGSVSLSGGKVFRDSVQMRQLHACNTNSGTDSSDNPRKAKLTLADGTVFEGISFGSETPVNGEVVFSTGMTGYTEALTDPSFRGQVSVLFS